MANNLIDSSIPEARSLLCVLKGFHDLHNFVPDFWSDHVVSFILMHSTSKKQLTKSDLDLLSRFQTLGRRANESGPIDPTIQLSPQQLEQVSALHQLPGLQNLVRRFLCFRASRCLSLECYLFVHLALVSVVLFFVQFILLFATHSSSVPQRSESVLTLTAFFLGGRRTAGALLYLLFNA
jgi:hypothetical protein